MCFIDHSFRKRDQVVNGFFLRTLYRIMKGRKLRSSPGCFVPKHLEAWKVRKERKKLVSGKCGNTDSMSCLLPCVLCLRVWSILSIHHMI